ncbi:LacI family DNA-binding transcriptional regulator [Arthrobacter sp. AB6]|uniref:LacI family DNA-binding transcriptional regulator n=1 Tax=Arthrobacter sp. AB6 TaxID=2962570 RepID=UPI002881A55C|nr:LacI family DNA-binding transcriptional regulator [Arthrobacter sp. AB6]MDT0196478.1 LacI family DNA-binding transcriptional regulator [Arthrobacter sp. AB6]
MENAMVRPLRPSLQQVASIAGVAPSTVSRFLNGKLAIASDTEERILKAVQETGYRRVRDRPSAVSATSERVAPANVIAIVVPRIRDGYFADLAEYVGDAAERNGFASFVYSTRDRTLDNDAIVEMLASDGVCGVIYAGLQRTHSGIQQVLEAGKPVVALAEPIPGVAVATVRVDHYSGANQAVAYLTRMGHRKIALIGGPEWLESNKESSKGFSEALRQSGVDPEDQLQLFGEISKEFGTAALSEILLSPKRPSAVFVTADEIALGIYSAAKDLGVRIPEDLSIVGSDDIFFARHLTPALTSVRLPRDRMAAMAVDILISRLGGTDIPASDVRLPVTLVVRDSVVSLA